MDIAKLIQSPLMEMNRPGNYLRLCLSEAAGYGVPSHIVALLDDLGAMLGIFTPLPRNASDHMAAPYMAWRTDPRQPAWDRVHDVERLAMKQRALIAYGGGRPNETVGTAEIALAMGNSLMDSTPKDFYEVFVWASIDTLKIITGKSAEQILREPEKMRLGWKIIPDDDVLTPGGRLYQVYIEIATSIRREAISHLVKERTPREQLLPFARQFLAANAKVRATAIVDGNKEMIAFLDKSDDAILTMFPSLRIDAYAEPAAAK